MATGTGKTKVISLAIAWQYFNAVLENARRLRQDHSAHRAQRHRVRAPQARFRRRPYLRVDPVIPPELKLYWDVEFYMRGDGERASSQGAIYLTNIQQLYDRNDRSKRTTSRTS